METDFISMLAARLDEAFGFTTTHPFTPQQSADHGGIPHTTAEVSGAGLWRDLVHRLLDGPVDPRDLAASYPGLDVPAIIEGFSATEFTPNGRICGSLLTHIPTDHSIEFSPTAHSPICGTAWTWCYFDALLMACIFQQPALISSTCSHTGRKHTLRLFPTSGSAVPAIAKAPEHLTVSFPSCFTPGASLREDFCCRSRGWLHSSLHACAQPSCTDTAAGVRYIALTEALTLTADVAHRLSLLPAQVEPLTVPGAAA